MVRQVSFVREVSGSIPGRSNSFLPLTRRPAGPSQAQRLNSSSGRPKRASRPKPSGPSVQAEQAAAAQACKQSEQAAAAAKQAQAERAGLAAQAERADVAEQRRVAGIRGGAADVAERRRDVMTWTKNGDKFIRMSQILEQFVTNLLLCRRFWNNS